MDKQYKTFEDLDCWKVAREVRLLVKETMKLIPKNEFDLRDNMTRVAHSCTRNIAEGYGRFHYQENIQFCRISRGSMYEIMDDYITCKDERYINEENYSQAKELLQRSVSLINGYINYLAKAKENS